MQIKHSQNHLTLLKLSAIALIGLCAADAQAQSGSRGAAPSGSASRAISQAVPVQSFQQPTTTFPSQSQPVAVQQSLAPDQTFTPTQSFTPDQTFAPTPSFSSPQGFVTDQTFAPAQSSMQPIMQGATSADASGGGSLGIPQSSLVDPVFEVHDPYSGHSVDHSTWDSFLQRYLVTGARGVNRIRYRQVTDCDRQQLNCYLHRLQNTDIRALNRDEQLAFWFNIYNAKTASIVLENYPIRSVRQIKQKFTDFVGPFDDEGVVNVLGKPLSLNDIESGIIRPVWKDPRIHYAVNCASFGCPNLSPTAWTAANIDSRLNSAAYDFINSGRAVRSGLRGVRLSKIYKWYKDDFGGDDESVLAHVRQYSDNCTANTLCNQQSISGYFYDWSLNDAKVTRPRLLESWRR